MREHLQVQLAHDADRVRRVMGYATVLMAVGSLALALFGGLIALGAGLPLLFFLEPTLFFIFGLFLIHMADKFFVSYVGPTLREHLLSTDDYYRGL